MFDVFVTPMLVGALLLVAVLLLVNVVGALRNRVPLRRLVLSTKPLSYVAVMALICAAIGCIVGWDSDFYILDPDQMCASAAGFYTSGSGPSDDLWLGIVRETLPVKRTCVWADGTTYELVPSWVNPLVFSSLAVFVAALVAIPFGPVPQSRKRGSTPSTVDESDSADLGADLR